MYNWAFSDTLQTPTTEENTFSLSLSLRFSPSTSPARTRSRTPVLAGTHAQCCQGAPPPLDHSHLVKEVPAEGREKAGESERQREGGHERERSEPTHGDRHQHGEPSHFEKNTEGEGQEEGGGKKEKRGGETGNAITCSCSGPCRSMGNAPSQGMSTLSPCILV